MSKKKTVIFGGSFNPVHCGHVALAAEVCRAGLATEVWLMVSPHNPLKAECGLAPEQQRLEMVKMAVDGLPGLVACDFEF
jgi:nicotinate-nucleotide adenylyltransferase